jgi:hypothetical protein
MILISNDEPIEAKQEEEHKNWFLAPVKIQFLSSLPGSSFAFAFIFTILKWRRERARERENSPHKFFQFSSV